MDEDDLPPRPGAPQEETAAGSMGRLFGSLVWIALFAVAAVGILTVLVHFMR